MQTPVEDEDPEASGLAVVRLGAHVRSVQPSNVEDRRARVFNAMAHSATFQAASASFARGPSSALRWSQLPGVSGQWAPLKG